MKRTFKALDILGSNRINEAQLSSEINLEIAALKGLDIFTSAHVQGVVKKTTAICQKMGMPYDELKKCVLAAYLHDVGKIKIPPEILQKTDKSTDEEFEIMKKHTIYGYEICMEYPNFRKLAPIVRAHHENMDGTGYPDGLKGDEIPKEAQLIKVADVYDALTQKRQYKEGFRISQALEIMVDDVRRGKMSGEYLSYLLMVVHDEVVEQKKVYERNVDQYKYNLEILHELEGIYKQIYDQGLTKKLEKKLKKYELAPGYDMSTNANLLVMKQKALEKEIEKMELYEDEQKKIKKLIDELGNLL